jgi:hypothetical protein
MLVLGMLLTGPAALASKSEPSQPTRTIAGTVSEGSYNVQVFDEGLKDDKGICETRTETSLAASSPNQPIELEIFLNENCEVEIVSVGGSATVDDTSVESIEAYQDLTGSSPSGQDLVAATTSPDTCRSEFHRRDPFNITLTGVNHETRWSFNGASVSLVSIWTQLVWSAGTNWSVTSGPTQSVVDGNGGSSDRTRGQGSFKWNTNQFRHTLKIENVVKSNGSCVGYFTATGEVPGAGWFHKSTVVKD